MSDLSSNYDTTYSEDERIDLYLKTVREKNVQHAADIQQQRSDLFQLIYAMKNDPIFSLPGLKFLYFKHTKIKFYFRPSAIVEYVSKSKSARVYCKLVYDEKFNCWGIKRNTLSGNCQRKIYSWFSDFAVGDEEVVKVILGIYETLKASSIKEHKYREQKYKRYMNGELEDFEMDDVDQEIFFDERAKSEFRSRRNDILKRMLPPDERENFDEIERVLFKESSPDYSD